MSPDMINLLIIVIPTVIFGLLLGFGIIFGIIRGFRKSLILGIQALVAFAIVFVFFMVFIFADPDGKKIVSATNGIAGNGWLQSTIASATNKTVSTSTVSLKEILMELIPQFMDFKDAIQSVIVENGAYVMTLVNFIIRFVYAIISLIIYLLLVFIFYIIYVIFYPERRHKRRVERKYERLERDKPYKKRRLLGLLIGTIRGLISSLTIAAFIGSILFMVTGSDGNKKYEDSKVEFSNKEFSDYYNMYQAIESYGSNGIYKVLGVLKNKDQIPYYLYITEMFYSGHLTDTSRNIDNQNIWMVEEVGAYTKFVNDITDLVIKYGFDELDGVLANPNDQEKINALVKALDNEKFQEDFDKVIDDFDAKTYFSNFALSLVDSIAIHIDGLTEGMDATTANILKILFTGNAIEGYETGENLAHLTPSDLLSSDDAKTLLKVTLPLVLSNAPSFIEYATNSDNEPPLKEIISILKGILPEFKNMSALNDETKATNLNNTLERLYQYMDKVLAEKIDEKTSASGIVLTKFNLVTETTTSGTNWVDEIQNLLDVGINVIKIAENILPSSLKDIDFVDLLLNIFQGEKGTENIELFDGIKETLSASRLVSTAMSTAYLRNLILTALNNLSEDIYISPNITYHDTKDESGKVIRGETYYLLDGIEQALVDKDTVDNLKTIISNDGELAMSTLFDAINNLATAEKDDDGKVTKKSVLSTLIESKFLRCVVSGVLVKYSKEDTISKYLYIPDVSFETENGTVVNIITKNEFDIVIDNVPTILPILKEFLDEDSENYNNVSYILKSLNNLGDDLFDNLLDSNILNYSISKTIYNLDIQGFTIFIPKTAEVETTDTIMTRIISKDDISSLLNNLLSIIPEDFDFDNMEIGNIIPEIIKNKDNLLVDKIILASVVNYLSTNEEIGKYISIPSDYLALAAKENLENLDVNNSPWRTELSNLFDVIDVLVDVDSGFEFDDEFINQIMDQLSTLNDYVEGSNETTKLDVCYKSNILLATLSEQIGEVLKTDGEDALLDEAAVAASKIYYPNLAGRKDDPDYLFIKKEEFESIVYAINYLDLDLTQDIDVHQIFENILSLNEVLPGSSETKLNKIYNYDVVLIPNMLTKQLDKVFTEDLIDKVQRDSQSVKTKISTANNLYVYYPYEVKVLIDTLKELDITDIDNFDVSSIKSSILSFNEASKTDTTKTKLGVLYSSSLLQYIITKQLKNVILNTDNPLLSEKEFNIACEKDTAGITIIKQEEIKNIINSVKILDISDFDNLKVDDIKGEIFKLNDKPEGSDETKLHTLYKSSFIKFIVSSEIKKAFNADLVEQGIFNSNSVVSELTESISGNNEKVTYIKEDEIKYIIDSAVELGISDISSIDASAVSSKITNLNALAETNTSVSKLNVLYSSVIIKFVLTKQLKGAFTSDLVDDNVLKLDEIYDVLDGTYKFVKKEEVKYIIYSVNELGISNINNIEINNVKAEITKLNADKTVTDGNDDNVTKLDIIYSSVILKFMISKQLKEAFNADLVDQDVLSLTSVNQTTSGLSFVKKEEVKYIIYSVNELGITDVSNIDLNVIKAEITNLNSDKTVTDGVSTNKTKLDIIYSSVILKFVISKQLKEAFNADLVDQAVLSFTSVNQTTSGLSFVKKEEVKYIIYSVNELGITDVSNIDLNVVKAEITNLNSDKTVTDGNDDNVTKLDVIYSSIILKFIISKQITANVTSLVEEKALQTDAAVANLEEKTFIIKNEVKYLLDALKALGITNLDNFDTDKVEATVLTLNDTPAGASETKLETIYKSIIISSAVTKQLKTNLSGMVEDDEILSDVDVSDVVGTTTKYSRLSKYEVEYILYSLIELGIDDVDSINLNNVQSKILNLNNVKTVDDNEDTNTTKLDILYSSTIIKYVLAKNIRNVLTDGDLVRNAVLNSNKVESIDESDNIENYYYYIKESVSSLIVALDELGVTDINNFADVNFSEKISTLDFEKIYESIIASDVLYTKLSDILTNNTAIVDHDNAKGDEFSVGVLFYKQAELSDMQGFLNASDITNIETFAVSQIKLNDDTIKYIVGDESIAGSWILRATISNNIITNDTFIVPTSTYDSSNSVLKDTDLKDLLMALKSFGEGSLNGFDAENIAPKDISDVDALAKSTVMRANITKNIKNDNKSVYAEYDYVLNTSDYLSKDTDLNENSIAILTKNETINLINAFNKLTGGSDLDANVNFDTLKNIKVEDQVEILKSNVMLFILSDIILSYNISSISYESLLLNFATIDIKDSNNDHLFDYSFADSDSAYYPYKFNAKANKSVCTLAGSFDSTLKQNALTDKDIIAFIYFINESAKGTYLPGTHYTHAS